MTTIQLRAEIKEAVDKVPDTALNGILDLLHELQDQPASDLELINFVRQAFKEDRVLLEKLAQ